MTVGIDLPTAALPAVSQPPRPRFVATTSVDPLASLPKVDRLELSDDVPPPELGAEIDLAFERAAELAAQNRELHFAKDEESGRIVVQIRDLDGNVIRTVPSTEVFDVIAGAELS